MDDRRFDALTRAFGRGGSRRALLKGLLGVGGVAAAGAVLHDTDAARRGSSSPSMPTSEPIQTPDLTDSAPRPTPTNPPSPKCPGSQEPCGAGCCCPAGNTKCGAECCPDGEAVCCDGACCYGVCYGEGLCCEQPRVFCAVTGQCCVEGETCGDQGCAGGNCGALGAACTTDNPCCAPNVCADGFCVASCPVGYRLCDRVCYPGGCCDHADCGPCLVCGPDHICHACEELGWYCQNGICVSTPPTSTPSPTPTATPSPSPTNTPSPTATASPSPTDTPTPSVTPSPSQTATPSATPSPSPSPTATPCGPDGTGCGDGSMCCGGACIDVKSNPAHCGGCHTACAPGQVCDLGVCCTPLTCKTGQCGGQPDGCGSTLDCGPCSTGQTCCAGMCFDLQTDPAHCGTCTHACQAGQTCCNGTCANLENDPRHCGTCDTACAAGQTCCFGQCANLQTDPDNCGVCEHACETGLFCCDGTCMHGCFSGGKWGCCPAGESCCGTVCCADGGCCGDECCPAGQSCCGEACCHEGGCCDDLTCCGGDAACCVGSCCGAGQVCCDDECCGDALHGCCDGNCVRLDTPENCGACDVRCADGQVCYEQACCVLLTCEGRCGQWSDGCGGTIDCGDCPADQCLECGRSKPGICSSVCEEHQVCYQGECCTPTCPDKRCGHLSDGCGGTMDCTCTGDGEICVHGGCFIHGHLDSCNKVCPCSNSNSDCCLCIQDVDGSGESYCSRFAPEPHPYPCQSHDDCPEGWVCTFTWLSPVCYPPC